MELTTKSVDQKSRRVRPLQLGHRADLPPTLRRLGSRAAMAVAAPRASLIPSQSLAKKRFGKYKLRA